jgi:hypothetical protein
LAEHVVAAYEQVARLGLAARVVVLELPRVGAEGRRLDDLGAEEDVGEPEAPPDDAAVPEHALDLVGRRARHDVEVLGPQAEEEVADATSDEVGEVFVVSESLDDLGGVGIDLIRRNLHVGSLSAIRRGAACRRDRLGSWRACRERRVW